MIITLTSDFGQGDGYAGVMKGVILSIAPHARLVDLSHDIAPQAIRQGAHVLAGAAPFFPPDTIHLAVVDPGVGSARRPLIVTTGRAVFVGPDNGLFTFALEQEGARAWLIDEPAYWLPHISRTFHGRDIFAPVAAHLAAGTAVAQLASPLADPVWLPRLEPARAGNGAIVGHVTYVDRFGNLISDIPGEWLRAEAPAGRRWIAEVAGQRFCGPVDAYAAVEPGALALLVSSGGAVEIAVRNGNAAHRLGVEVGAIIQLRPT